MWKRFVSLRARDETCTHDAFFRPVTYEPEQLSLDTMKLLVKQRALTRSNYFMYDEDETTPLFIQRAGSWLIRVFAPRQPIWRLFILMRMLQRLTGLGLIRRILHLVARRRAFRPAAGKDRPLLAGRRRTGEAPSC